MLRSVLTAGCIDTDPLALGRILWPISWGPLCRLYVCTMPCGSCSLKLAVIKVMWLTKGAALFGGTVVTLALVFGVAHPLRKPP
jgi:hypothetical protein